MGQSAAGYRMPFDKLRDQGGGIRGLADGRPISVTEPVEVPRACSVIDKT